MSVHRVRIWHSQAGAASFHGWLDVWLTNMTPWASDEVTNTLPALVEPIDGDAHYRGELAFAWTEDKAIIMDQLVGYLSAYCDWHQIAYHVCTHDEADPTPCAWDDVNRDGTLPDAVPTIEVSA
jgi:hypothetical protein